MDTRDDRTTQAEVATTDTGLGLHVADIATAGMAEGRRITFTWRRWSDGILRGRNFDGPVVVA